MKTLKIIPALLILLMFICLSGISSYAANPVATSSDNIHKMIKESVTYPEKALKNGCCGKVYVTFSLTEEGKIDIDEISTDNKEISNSVKEQLSNLCCKGINSPSYKHYSICITFKLI